MASDPLAAEQGQATAGVDSRPAPRKASAAKLNRMKQSTERQIDEFMKKVGYANPSERTDDHGWRWFEFGSARGRAAVVESDADGGLYLRAESMVMELPTDEDKVLPLMRELLEANMTIAGAARLGISGKGVFVCATMPVVGLAADDVPAHIHAVMAIAESFGNPFAEEASDEGASQTQTPPENTVTS